MPHGSHSQAEKRAHHNALERKRRDHIKDSFTSLREAVPSLQGEKVDSLKTHPNWLKLIGSAIFQASRAQILKKAAEYIQSMRRKQHSQIKDIEDLRRQNSIIESQSKCTCSYHDGWTPNGPAIALHFVGQNNDSFFLMHIKLPSSVSRENDLLFAVSFGNLS